MVGNHPPGAEVKVLYIEYMKAPMIRDEVRTKRKDVTDELTKHLVLIMSAMEKTNVERSKKIAQLADDVARLEDEVCSLKENLGKCASDNAGEKTSNKRNRTTSGIYDAAKSGVNNKRGRQPPMETEYIDSSLKSQSSQKKLALITHIYVYLLFVTFCPRSVSCVIYFTDSHTALFTGALSSSKK